jgi:UDP-glucose 4-epimerase
MKILFTGSSGPKVGARVAAVLAQAHEMVGIDTDAGALTTHQQDIVSVANWAPLLDGVDAVVHFAALHAPHRATHSRAAFYDTNVHATARLIEAAKSAGVARFVMASTTSVYGRAMRSRERAVWVNEELTPAAEDIYDETKLAAEALCSAAFAPTFVTIALRFSRCFPEPPPLMTLYRLYRGVDARDVAQAFSLALTAPLSAFAALNVSGATPFVPSDVDALMHDAPSVLSMRAPELVSAFAARTWPLPTSIDRVYAIDLARRVLGYAPAYGWQSCLPGDGADSARAG